MRWSRDINKVLLGIPEVVPEQDREKLTANRAYCGLITHEVEPVRSLVSGSAVEPDEQLRVAVRPSLTAPELPQQDVWTYGLQIIDIMFSKMVLAQDSRVVSSNI